MVQAAAVESPMPAASRQQQQQDALDLEGLGDALPATSGDTAPVVAPPQVNGAGPAHDATARLSVSSDERPSFEYDPDEAPPELAALYNYQRSMHIYVKAKMESFLRDLETSPPASGRSSSLRRTSTPRARQQ